MELELNYPQKSPETTEFLGKSVVYMRCFNPDGKEDQLTRMHSYLNKCEEIKKLTGQLYFIF